MNRKAETTEIGILMRISTAIDAYLRNGGSKIIYIDMDGTINSFYDVDGWLTDLHNESVRPYLKAKGKNLPHVARLLKALQKQGWRINILTALSDGCSRQYGERIKEAKFQWLRVHLPSIKFDDIIFLDYKTQKGDIVDKTGGFLIDDNQTHLESVKNGIAIDAKYITPALKFMKKGGDKK